MTFFSGTHGCTKHLIEINIEEFREVIKVKDVLKNQNSAQIEYSTRMKSRITAS